MIYFWRCIIIKPKKRALASQEDIKLLSKSECIKRYKCLYELFKSFIPKKSPIYLEDTEILKKDKQSYNTIRYSFKELVEEASSEWVNVGCVDTKKIVCDLCGSSNLKFNFKIKNQINNNEMIIGSSCIEKFPNINSGNVNMKEHKSRANKIYRSNYINEIYPNIVDMINSWKNFYSSFPILLNEELNSKFTNLLKDSDAFYNDFINGKILQKDAYNFKNYIDEFNLLKKEANYFLDEKKDNIYICDRKIVNWISQNIKDKEKLIDIIRKNDGLIDENTSKYIYSIDFIRRFQKNIESEFGKFNFYIESLNKENGIVISYKVSRNNIIKLSMRLSGFMKKFNFICFDSDKCISKEKIIAEFGFYIENDNINNLIYEINLNLEDTKYYVEANGKYLRFIRNKKYEDKYNKHTEQYTEIDINKFFDIIKNELLNQNKNIRKIILNKIHKFKNWIDADFIKHAMRNDD